MRALVLLSGGLDSATALFWARTQGWDVEALTFDYDARPGPERAATEALVATLGVPLHTVEAPWMQEIEAGQHPLLDNPALAGAPEGYIPARNAILYAIGAYHAELRGARVLVGGHNSADPETFPDAAAGYFATLGALLEKGLASGGSLEIVQPLLGLDKVGVVRLALELEVPLDLSWSCYDAGPERCGRCPSCVERAEAFGVVGMADPAVVG